MAIRTGMRGGQACQSVLAAGVLACLLGLLAAGGCRDSSSPTPGAASDPLVGRWESEPTLSQLGRIVHRYEFRADQTVAASLAFVDAKIPPMEMKGTWSAEGKSLRFEGRNASGGMSYAFEGDTLVLTEPNGDSYRLARK